MAATLRHPGPKADKIWRDAIMRAVNRMSADKKTKHIDILAHRLIKCAADGDVSAMREIGDRLDGKATQPISGEDGGAVPVRFIVENGPATLARAAK